jgi:hypothetical protein
MSFVPRIILRSCKVHSTLRLKISHGTHTSIQYRKQGDFDRKGMQEDLLQKKNALHYRSGIQIIAKREGVELVALFAWVMFLCNWMLSKWRTSFSSLDIQRAAYIPQYSDQTTGWTTWVRFPTGAGTLPLHHHAQSGSGAHPASCPMDTEGSFIGG